MKRLLKYFLYILFLITTVSIASVLIVGLEQLVVWGVDLAGLADKKSLILPLVSSVRTTPLVIALAVILAAICLAIYKLDLVYSYLKIFFSYWREAFVNLFASCKVIEIWVLVAIPLVASIYFASDIAVSYDEAITYNLFTSKPFFYSMIFYPYPNNHVLHSLITNLTEYAPFVSTLFAIRIPAIVASLFTNLLVYSFIKKYYSSRIALLIVGITSAMYMTIYYSFMSRGYAFMVLAFVVCLYAAFNIIKNGSRNKDWMFFIVAGILGCYTIPSFLYPFATVNVLILIYNYKNIRQQIAANLIAGICVVLLYAPIMLVDGVAALTSNQFVQQVGRVDIIYGIFDFYKGMFAKITGLPYNALFALLVLIAISVSMSVYQKDRWHLALWVVFIAAPFVLIILHAVHPFYRTFLYYNVLYPFLLLIPFRKYLEKIPKYLLLIFILLIQLLGVYTFDNQIRENEGFNTYAKMVVNTYFKKENTILFPTIASANYEFEAKVLGLEANIHFIGNEVANVDTIQQVDYVILSNHRDRTIDKKPFDVIGEVHIYKNSK